MTKASAGTARFDPAVSLALITKATDVSTRGWEGVTLADIHRVDRAAVNRQLGIHARSKYRNVRTITPEGERFDSLRELNYWRELQVREKAGEITKLSRQVTFPLLAPVVAEGIYIEVARFVVDFTFEDRAGVLHCQDVKGGPLTQFAALKIKWLKLQTGLDVEIIR